jgi:hypothetical protein
MAVKLGWGSQSTQLSWDCPCMVVGYCPSKSSSDCSCSVESPCLSRAHQTVPVLWKVLVSPELIRLSLYGRRSLSLQSSIRMSLYGWNSLISPELIRLSLYGWMSLSLQSSSECLCLVEGPCLFRAQQTVPLCWKVLVSPELIRPSMYGGRSLSLQRSSDCLCMVKLCVNRDIVKIVVLYSETLSCHLRSHEIVPVRLT